MSGPDSQIDPEDDGKADDEESTIAIKEALFEAIKRETVVEDEMELAGNADDCIDLKVEATSEVNTGESFVVRMHLEVLIQQKVRDSVVGLGILRRTKKSEIIIPTPVVVRLVQSLTEDLRREFVEKLFNPEIDKILYTLEQKHKWEALPFVQEPAAALREELLSSQATYGSFSGFFEQSAKRKPDDPTLPTRPTAEEFDKAMSIVALKIVKRVMRRDRETAADLGDAPLEAISISVHSKEQGKFSLLIQYKDMRSLGEIENLLYVHTNEIFVVHPDVTADIINRMKGDDEEKEARETIARYILHVLLDVYDPEGKENNFTVDDALGFYERIRNGKLKKYRETSGDLFHINDDEDKEDTDEMS